MKLGIMQPYFLPYIGYWQLMNAVDEYVIFDDVNFISRGWVNRNRMLCQGKDLLFTIPLVGASPFRRIDKIEIVGIPDKFKRAVQVNYRKAPCYDQVLGEVLEKIYACPDRNLAGFLANSIRVVADYLGIRTRLLRSSAIEKDESLHGEEKIVDICRRRFATEYYNAIGGRELYHRERFAAEGMALHFLRPQLAEYPQFGATFVPGLSILDVMMFNDRERIRDMLGEFDLA